MIQRVTDCIIIFHCCYSRSFWSWAVNVLVNCDEFWWLATDSLQRVVTRCLNVIMTTFIGMRAMTCGMRCLVHMPLLLPPPPSLLPHSPPPSLHADLVEVVQLTADIAVNTVALLWAHKCMTLVPPLHLSWTPYTHNDTLGHELANDQKDRFIYRLAWYHKHSNIPAPYLFRTCVSLY